MNLILNILLAAVLAVRGLVIPVQFEDLKFVSDPQSIKNITDGAETYFNAESLSIGELKFDVSEVYSDPKSYRVYGKNDSGSKDALFYRLAQNACRALDKAVDFSQYEYILFALPGKSEPDSGEEDLFWPQAASLVQSNASITLDGRKIDSYAVFCELGPDGEPAGIGDFAHETAHLLGLPDFYDTDDARSGGVCEGLGGEFSLMDKGNRAGQGRTPPPLCAAELDVLAPSRCRTISKGSGRLLTDGVFNRLETGCEGSYFLLENRDGLCVTAIDKSETPAGYSEYQKRVVTAAERWALNEVNCRPDRPCAYSLARGLKTSDRCIKLDSLAIVDIKSWIDGSVSFRIIEPISVVGVTSLQNGALLEWESGIDSGLISEARVEWWLDGEKLHVEDAAIAGEGRYSAYLRGLKSASLYYVALRLTTTEGEEFRLIKSFRTRVITEGSAAFIYIPPGVKNADGSFRKGARMPLSVYNACGAEKISWFFDGSEVGADGYLDLNSDGVLRAVIGYGDGSKETITRKISVR